MALRLVVLTKQAGGGLVPMLPGLSVVLVFGPPIAKPSLWSGAALHCGPAPDLAQLELNSDCFNFRSSLCWSRCFSNDVLEP